MYNNMKGAGNMDVKIGDDLKYAGGKIGDKPKVPADRTEKLKILNSLIEGIIYNGKYEEAIRHINSIIEP